MLTCFKCPKAAAWELDTRTSSRPEGQGLRPFCDEHATVTRDMIEDVYRDSPAERRNLLSRLRPLVVQ